MGFFQYARLALFSKQPCDRQLYRLVKSQRTCRIVELGIGSLERTENVLALAAQGSKQSRVLYAGFDAFEERDREQESLSLIDAHRRLVRSEASVRLVPGGATAGLPSMANGLRDTDLVLISASVTDQQLDPVWFYLPRMCHPGTQVLRQTDESGGAAAWSPISLEAVRQLSAKPRLRAA